VHQFIYPALLRWVEGWDDCCESPVTQFEDTAGALGMFSGYSVSQETPEERMSPQTAEVSTAWAQKGELLRGFVG
jgi:hypothetical protein